MTRHAPDLKPSWRLTCGASVSSFSPRFHRTWKFPDEKPCRGFRAAPHHGPTSKALFLSQSLQLPECSPNLDSGYSPVWALQPTGPQSQFSRSVGWRVERKPPSYDRYQRESSYSTDSGFFLLNLPSVHQAGPSASRPTWPQSETPGGKGPQLHQGAPNFPGARSSGALTLPTQSWARVGGHPAMGWRPTSLDALSMRAEMLALMVFSLVNLETEGELKMTDKQTKPGRTFEGRPTEFVQDPPFPGFQTTALGHSPEYLGPAWTQGAAPHLTAYL